MPTDGDTRNNRNSENNENNGNNENKGSNRGNAATAQNTFKIEETTTVPSSLSSLRPRFDVVPGVKGLMPGTPRKAMPHIFIAIPAGVGSVNVPVLPALQGCTLRQYQRALIVQTNSSLTHNFNMLWYHCLNDRERYGFTHFLMLHSDIAPHGYWLDEMMDVMNERDWDVVSVVSPIKDGRGLTSTAFDTNRWRPRRITMAELERMPDSFDNADLLELDGGGRAKWKSGVPLYGPTGILLPNTGLMLVRFDRSRTWLDKVCFEFRNRIVREAMDDGNITYVPDFEPEDWRFGRFLHQHGVRYGITKKVKLTHCGTFNFLNHTVWGEFGEDKHNMPWAMRGDTGHYKAGSTWDDSIRDHASYLPEGGTDAVSAQK